MIKTLHWWDLPGPHYRTGSGSTVIFTTTKPCPVVVKIKASHTTETELNVSYSSTTITHYWLDLLHSTRCGPYFGTTVEAVQCLTHQTEWNVRTCKKEGKHTLFCGGGGEERISLRCRQVTSKASKTVKNVFVLQFCSWDGSFRHGEMKTWLCLYFQHVTRHIGTDFVEESRQKCKDQKRSIFWWRGLW